MMLPMHDVSATWHGSGLLTEASVEAYSTCKHLHLHIASPAHNNTEITWQQ